MVRTAERAKRDVWVAHAAPNDGGVLVYGTPIRYRWNWRGLNSAVDIAAFGPRYVDYRRATMPVKDMGQTKRLDRVWMDTTPSDPTDQLASDADFYVYGANRGVTGVGEVLFKRLSPDE